MTNAEEFDVPVFTEEVEDEADRYNRHEIRNTDMELESILALVLGPDDSQSAEGSFELTLVTGAGTVSGIAVTERAWVEAVDASLRASGGTLAEALAAERKRTQPMVDKRRADREAAGRVPRIRRYVHFKDVRVGNQSSYTAMGLLRVDLRKVIGWTLGSWNPSAE